MDKIFTGVKGKSLKVYVDDVLVKSKTTLEHLEHLAKVFWILRKHNMKLNPLKCTFGTAAGILLGHHLLIEGIAANLESRSECSTSLHS